MLKEFGIKYRSFIRTINAPSEKVSYDSTLMINNFIVFSEDGLIMKDSEFHSVDSCKNFLERSLPMKVLKENQNYWVFISVESWVSRIQLTSILLYFDEKNIEYIFGTYDELNSIIIKKNNDED